MNYCSRGCGRPAVTTAMTCTDAYCASPVSSPAPDANRVRTELLAEIDVVLQGTPYWQGGRLDTIKHLVTLVKKAEVALLRDDVIDLLRRAVANPGPEPALGVAATRGPICIYLADGTLISVLPNPAVVGPPAKDGETPLAAIERLMRR